MLFDNVNVKPETRNHKGFFVMEGDYKLVDMHTAGWAMICSDEACCHYVDPDSLLPLQEVL
jgi:hypothetical protein